MWEEKRMEVARRGAAVSLLAVGWCFVRGGFEGGFEGGDDGEGA